MATEDSSSKDDKPLSGLPLARRFLEIGLEEFASGDRERMKNGCEKGFRAAMVALDVLLHLRGYSIDIGRPEAHLQRSKALSELIEIDQNMKQIRDQYSVFTTELHGMGFYSNADPKIYATELHQVEEFIDLIEELVTIK